MELIDTLETSKKLRSAGWTDAQADAMVDILRHITQTNLASKEDIKTIERDIEQIRRDIEQLRADTKKDIEQLRTDTKKDIENLRIEFKKDIAEVKKEISEAKYATITWVAGLLLVNTGLMITLMKLL